MAQLQYENVFESIATSKKQARAMETASDVLNDLDDALIVLGYRQDERNKIIRAVHRLHFSKYN